MHSKWLKSKNVIIQHEKATHIIAKNANFKSSEEKVNGKTCKLETTTYTNL